MKTLLALTPVPVTAAATRFRVQQFAPVLREAGIDLVLRPFLDERGFDVIYRPGESLAKLVAGARASIGRLEDLVRATAADAVLIQREAALVGPPLLEWLIARIIRKPVVLDLDDPVWVPYDSPTYGALLSRLVKMPGKTNTTIRAAREVIAGNPYVADYARGLAASVTLIPTVVDTESFKPRQTANHPPVIGWIGSHSSASFLRLALPALQRLAREEPFLLRLIGGNIDTTGVPTEIRDWSLAREVDDFQSLDIGIYPMTENTWTVGKSGFKAVQYMACGTPVVASPVGVTREMIRHGENGFLADSDQGWYEMLRALVKDPDLRLRVGSVSRKDCEDHWSLRVHGPRFTEVISRVIHGTGR